MRKEEDVRKLVAELDKCILVTTAKFRITAENGQATIHAKKKDFLHSIACTFQKAILHWVLKEPEKYMECQKYLQTIQKSDLEIENE